MSRLQASAGERASIAVDAGQTAIKVRVLHRTKGPSDHVFPGLRTHERLLPQLATIARTLHQEIGLPLDVLSVGASGLTSVESDAAGLSAMLVDLEVGRVILAHDSVTSFLGCLGDARGVVVAAGTGVVTLGVGERRVARVDGWGNIMGDAGSGYWIGREALDAAMRAYDGRGAPTALLEVVRERWPDIEGAYIDLQGRSDRVAVVASLSEAVVALSEADATAARIAEDAARQLSLSVVTALERVSEPDSLELREVVCPIGGVFRSRAILSRFEQFLHEVRPHADIEPARGSGLDGAQALSELDGSHPLRNHVSIAFADPPPWATDRVMF